MNTGTATAGVSVKAAGESPRVSPRLSVILPVYNGAKYVRAALDSVLAQTFRDFELIVIDDGSTDGSGAILEEFARRDARVRLEPNPRNLGLPRTLNKGLSLARAPLIARQDADDISLPERFEKQLALLEADPETVLVSCNMDCIDAQDYRTNNTDARHLHPEMLPWMMLFFNRIGGHGQVVFRLDAVNRAGRYDESFTFCEDGDLWARLIRVGRFHVLREKLYLYRVGTADSMTGKLQPEQQERTLGISVRAIEQSTGIKISVSEMEKLHVFWRHHTARPEDIPWLQTTFSRLADGYLPPQPIENLDARLAQVLARWWILAMHKISPREPRAKLRALLCALRWDATSVFLFVLRWPLIKLRRIGRTIFP